MVMGHYGSASLPLSLFIKGTTPTERLSLTSWTCYDEIRILTKTVGRILMARYPKNPDGRGWKVSMKSWSFSAFILLILLMVGQPAYGQGGGGQVQVSAAVTDGGATYTGLIINALGLPLSSGLSPRIYDISGKIVYGKTEVSEEFAISTGTVGYMHSLEEAVKKSRAGSNPLVIMAVSTRGDSDLSFYHTHVIVSQEDAGRIETVERENHFLADHKVVFLLDPQFASSRAAPPAPLQSPPAPPLQSPSVPPLQSPSPALTFKPPAASSQGSSTMAAIRTAPQPPAEPQGGATLPPQPSPPALAAELGLSQRVWGEVMGNGKVIQTLSSLPPDARKLYREMPLQEKERLATLLRGKTTILFFSIGNREAFVKGEAFGRDTFAMMESSVDEELAKGKISPELAGQRKAGIEVLRSLNEEQREAIATLLEMETSQQKPSS